jgi:hypothetical protein
MMMMAKKEAKVKAGSKRSAWKKKPTNAQKSRRCHHNPQTKKMSVDSDGCRTMM